MAWYDFFTGAPIAEGIADLEHQRRSESVSAEEKARLLIEKYGSWENVPHSDSVRLRNLLEAQYGGEGNWWESSPDLGNLFGGEDGWINAQVLKAYLQELGYSKPTHSPLFDLLISMNAFEQLGGGSPYETVPGFGASLYDQMMQATAGGPQLELMPQDFGYWSETLDPYFGLEALEGRIGSQGGYMDLDAYHGNRGAMNPIQRAALRGMQQDAQKLQLEQMNQLASAAYGAASGQQGMAYQAQNMGAQNWLDAYGMAANMNAQYNDLLARMFGASAELSESRKIRERQRRDAENEAKIEIFNALRPKMGGSGGGGGGGFGM